MMYKAGDRVIFTNESLHEIMLRFYPLAGTVGKILRELRNSFAIVQWKSGTTSADGIWQVSLHDIIKAPKIMVRDRVRIKSWKKLCKCFALEAGYEPAFKKLCGMIAWVKRVNGALLELEGNPVMDRIIEEKNILILIDMVERLKEEDCE